jgi:hypothetical protein
MMESILQHHKRRLDRHLKMMSKYKKTPNWWYMPLLLLCLRSQRTSPGGPSSLLLAFFAFPLPTGIIQAITNIQTGLNVLTDFIFGYIQPG